jgi:CubicO group peptidase (beta-lactamase class C family)
MKRGVKIILIGSAVALIAVAAAAGWLFTKAVPIGAGFVAKYLCSSTFISGRDPDVVFREDVAFVGSSYTFATPRDWARFGLLYLQDGVWQGERIFPPGWVKYTTTPTAATPRGEYGAHVWLNAGSATDPDDRRWPNAPRDAFAALGFQEQKVIVIPSQSGLEYICTL